MHRRRNRVDKTLVGVGREVNHNAGAGGDARGHLDVKHDFGIRAGGGRRRVFASIYADCGNRWRSDAQRLEISREIGCPVAAAQLDDADCLAGAACADWKLVSLGHLRRCVAFRLTYGFSLRRGRLGLLDAKVRLRLRAVVQPQHGHHQAGQSLRKQDAALAHAILLAINELLVELHAEGLLHGGGCSGELRSAACGGDGIAFNLQVKFLGEGGYLLDGFGVSRVVLLVLGAGNAYRAGSAAAAVVDLERLFALQDEGNGDFGRGRSGLHMLCVFCRGLFTSCQNNARLLRKPRSGDAGGLCHNLPLSRSIRIANYS
jgi:hypothetical protein